MGLGTRGRIRDSRDVTSALAELSEVEDRRAGIRERFLTPTIGGGRTVAVLATPLDAQRRQGWVLCHSYGMEQVTLATHEAPVARALASAGFPVLRYHGQGYGDSELPPDGVGLGSHLRDAFEAAEVLVNASGVQEVGYLGARLGGTVAALAAERSGAPAFVAWEPVVRGSRYARSLLTLSVLLHLMHQERDRDERPDPAQLLAERGVLDVQGFPLTVDMHEELVRLDLVERVTSFRGESLIVQISKGAAPRPDLERFAAHLRSLGGRSALTIVTDERANTFGESRYRPIGGGRKSDVQGNLGRALVTQTLEWWTSATSTVASEEIG